MSVWELRIAKRDPTTMRGPTPRAGEVVHVHSGLTARITEVRHEYRRTDDGAIEWVGTICTAELLGRLHQGVPWR